MKIEYEIEQCPVKFFDNEKYADCLVKGELYCRRLSYFKNAESRDKRGDELEGAIPLHGIETITIDGRTYKGANTVDNPVPFGYPSLENLNLFCLSFCDIYKIANKKYKLEIPTELSKFGNYAVAIMDFDEFLKRIENAIVREGYTAMCRGIEYYDPKSIQTPDKSPEEILFMKRDKFKIENEYRIAINTNTTKGDDAITLNIGDISDITYKIEFNQEGSQAFD